MKEVLINFINNMNIGYILISTLLLISSLIFMKKKNINKLLVEIFIILYVIILWIGFFLFNDTLNSIFKLTYFSIKSYLILLIIGNIIMLININFPIKKPYKIINYMLFLTNILIFIINLIIILSNKYNGFISNTLEDAIKLININIIIFIAYIICCLLIFISKHTILLLFKKIKISKPKRKEIITKPTEKEKIPQVITPIETKKVPEEKGFYIDGVDCSIIFEDSNKEDIIKNYYILLHDVNAKLINGYTLEEYKKIKNIINKLNIKDLNNINIDVNSLNKITIDEYNILKQYLNNRNNIIN